jgi:hypothetical protein
MKEDKVDWPDDDDFGIGLVSDLEGDENIEVPFFEEDKKSEKFMDFSVAGENDNSFSSL